MTKIEQKQDELICEYENLIALSSSTHFFNIPSVNILKSELASLRLQESQAKELSDEDINKHYPVILNPHTLDEYQLNTENICRRKGAKAHRDGLIPKKQ